MLFKIGFLIPLETLSAKAIYPLTDTGKGILYVNTVTASLPAGSTLAYL